MRFRVLSLLHIVVGILLLPLSLVFGILLAPLFMLGPFWIVFLGFRFWVPGPRVVAIRAAEKSVPLDTGLRRG